MVDTLPLTPNSVASLANPTGISEAKTDVRAQKAYTLQGTATQDSQRGIVIQQEKKVIR